MSQRQYKVTAEMLEIAAAQGMNPNQLAREAGVYRADVVRAERREMVSLKRAVREDAMKGRDYRDAVQDMRPIDAVEYLLGVIDELVDRPAQPWALPGVMMTVGERNVFYTLARAKGRIVSKVGIMRGYMLGRGADDEPELKIIDVFVSRLRKKLSGTGIEIFTQWGVGYRMTAPTDVVWPWDVLE